MSRVRPTAFVQVGPQRLRPAPCALLERTRLRLAIRRRIPSVLLVTLESFQVLLTLQSAPHVPRAPPASL